MKVNLYDFDKTIYDGDSSVDFYFYCLRKNKIIILLFPIQIFFAILYVCRLVTKVQFKTKFFLFLKFIKNIDETIEQFWHKNEYRIKKFYLNQKSEYDIIISASPLFLLEPISKKLNIFEIYATNMNKETGIITGNNCYGEEKVARLKEKDYIYENVYSDSMSDLPILSLGKNAFLVNGEKIKKLDLKQL